MVCLCKEYWWVHGRNLCEFMRAILVSSWEKYWLVIETNTAEFIRATYGVYTRNIGEFMIEM